jgi:endonuclease YncB( thermonuclease family)
MAKYLLVSGTLLALCSPLMAMPVLEKVIDGDTVQIQDQDRHYRLRLLDIDAPELHQAFGKHARRSLMQLCANATVSITIQGLDPYGRQLGYLYCDGTEANQSQVAQGMAWFNDRYSKRTTLQTLQQQAQAQGLGLWQSARPMPPWQWRKLYGQHYRHQD